MSELNITHIEIQTGTVPGFVCKCLNCKDNARQMNASTASLYTSTKNYGEKQWRWGCECGSLRNFEPMDDSVDRLIEITFYKNQRDPRSAGVSIILTSFFLPRKNARKLCRIGKKLEENKNNCLNVTVNGELHEDVHVRGVVC